MQNALRSTCRIVGRTLMRHFCNNASNFFFFLVLLFVSFLASPLGTAYVTIHGPFIGVGMY